MTLTIREKKTDCKLPCNKSKRDTVISEEIKKPLVNVAACQLVIGKCGQGKTHFYQSLLKRKHAYKGKFDHVFLVCPPASRNSFESDVFEEHDEEKMFDELSPETISNLQEKLEKLKEEHEADDSEDEKDPIQSLVIIDDCQAQLKECEKQLLHMMSSFRHTHVSVWVILQSYMALPKKCRDIARVVTMFKPSSMREIETWAQEVLPGFKFDDVKQLMRHCYRDKHDAVMVDRQRDTIARMHKMHFSDIITHNPDFDDEEVPDGD